MSDPFFFGYGSLVNRRTHGFSQAYPARITGWRRAWRHTALRELAFLTAVPEPGAEMEGLIAAVPGADWAALDEREWAYARHAVGHLVAHEAGAAVHVEVYAVRPEHSAPPTVRHPVLLSYIDTVVQGYLHSFGKAGAERFFATTEGWDLPVLNDRAAPRYSRAQAPGAEERELVDTHLARLGADLVEA
jgi:hypothetical protein